MADKWPVTDRPVPRESDVPNPKKPQPQPTTK